MNLVFIGLCVASASLAQQPARVEVLPPDRFSEVHAPLFTRPPSTDAGAVTERVSPSGSSAPLTSSVPRRNFVDQYIFGKLERDRVPHAPLATDYEFIRRVTLDLTGRIPSPGDVRAFVADREPWQARRTDRAAAGERSLRGQVGLLLHGPVPRQRQDGPRAGPVPLLDEGEPARRPPLRRRGAVDHRRLRQEQPRGGSDAT